jgi:isopenicillin N synthase-like dioxygenase
VKLGKSLFPLFALALNLSEDYFDDKVEEFYFLDDGGVNV